MFEDVLLDSLAVVRMSSNYDFARTAAALGTIEGGLLILVAGRLSEQAAKDLAATRRDGRQGIAVLLAVSTWADRPDADGSAGDDNTECATCSMIGQADDAPAEPHVHEQRSDETAPAEAILRAAGWRVVTADARTPFGVAWQRLPRTSSASARYRQLKPDAVIR
jgi:hypothetical protein